VYFVVAPVGADADDVGAEWACDDAAGAGALGPRVNVNG
jgi:hypothetical protein